MLLSLQEIDAHFDRALHIRNPLSQAPTPSRAKTPVKLKGSFPEWEEFVTGMPNWMIRSSLFGAFAKGKRERFENEILASFEGTRIRYTGHQLDQGDLSVWLMIVQYAYDSETQLGQPIRFTSYDILKALGKTDGGGNRKNLIDRIRRLTNHSIMFEQGRKEYIGRLIKTAWRDDGTGEHVVEIDQNLTPYFVNDQITWVNRKIRLELEEKPLAQWLHCYYSSHAIAHKHHPESLLRWSGSKNKYILSGRPSDRNALRSGLQTLRIALEDLRKACCVHGATFTWEVVEKKICAKLTFPSKQESATKNRRQASATEH